MISDHGANALLGLHAQTALHAGSGTALGVVDLPVQRERHTQWPTIPGSALKGVLRDACREEIAQLPRKQLEALPRFDDSQEKKAKRQGTSRTLADATVKLNAVFGPPTEGAGEFAGALSVTDARILAFPVRSLRGVFAWISCPGVLQRLQRDAALAAFHPAWEVPSVNGKGCLAPEGSPCLFRADGSAYAVLEEFDFEREDVDPGPVGSWIAEALLPDGSVFEKTRQEFAARLLVIADDMFSHFVRNATEVTARVGLDYETKTVDDKALFYQESLPSETLLYALLLANPTRAAGTESPAGGALLNGLAETLAARRYLQIGGDETVGKGYCAVQLNRALGESQ